MRRLLLLCLLAVPFAAFPTQADARKPCGAVTDEAGDVWRVGSYRVSCKQSLDRATRYLAFQDSRDQWTSPVVIDGFECYPSSGTGVQCTKWYRQGFWLIAPGLRVPIKRLFVPAPRLNYETSYMRKALRRKFDVLWTGGLGRKVDCRSLSRLRSRCSASWGIGDSGYNVWTRVRMKPRPHRSIILLRGKTRRFNWYCFAVLKKPPAKCSHWQRFGPQSFREF